MANLITRIQAGAKAGVDVFRHGYRQPRQLPAKMQSKKFPMMWPTWINGQAEWQIVDYSSYQQEGFSENAIVYSAIMYKYRAINNAPLRAYTGTMEEKELLPPDNQLQKLCARPNQWQSWQEFQGLNDVYLNLSGNCYIYLDRLPGQTTPEALYTFRPDRMFIVPNPKAREILGYLYVPEGGSLQEAVPYAAKDIMHVKFPNPGDRLDGMGYGLSPLSPGARSADVDNKVTAYLKLFFDKGAMIPGLLSFDVPMDTEDIAQARERWMEVYGGMENWSDIAILDQGGKYEKIGLSFDEMDMSSLDARNESRIVAPFGVPMTLIESRPELVASTYNNKETDRVMFWQDTMIPELNLFGGEYLYYLQGDGGEFVAFDFSEVPALKMSKQERLNAMATAFEKNAATKNEYRALLGLDPVDDGDEFKQPLQLEPTNLFDNEPEPGPPADDMDGMPEAEEEAEEAEADKTKALKFDNKEDRKTFWIKANEMAESAEPEYGIAAAEAFEENRRAVLAIINSEKKKSIQRKQTPDYDAMAEAITAYLSDESPAVWQGKFEPLMVELMTARMLELNSLYGSSASPQQLLSQQWFKDYAITFAQPIDDNTNTAIRALLAEAETEGVGTDVVSKRLGLMFDQWITGDLTPDQFDWLNARLPEFRTQMIARTETMRSLNYASNVLYETEGWDSEWLSTMDPPRARDTHMAVDGQVRKAGGYYMVDGERLRFPLDPAGSARNVVNCRCAEAPVI